MLTDAEIIDLLRVRSLIPAGTIPLIRGISGSVTIPRLSGSQSLWRAENAITEADPTSPSKGI